VDEATLEKVKLDHRIHKELTSVLANERTFAAWTRTGLAALVTGLAVAKFLHGTLPDVFIPIISMTLFFCSASFFGLAAWRYSHVGFRMKTTRVAGASTFLLIGLATLLGLVSVGTALGIWLLNLE
jgi:putative membrane protein